MRVFDDSSIRTIRIREPYTRRAIVRQGLQVGKPIVGERLIVRANVVGGLRRRIGEITGRTGICCCNLFGVDNGR